MHHRYSKVRCYSTLACHTHICGLCKMRFWFRRPGSLSTPTWLITLLFMKKLTGSNQDRMPKKGQWLELARLRLTRPSNLQGAWQTKRPFTARSSSASSDRIFTARYSFPGHCLISRFGGANVGHAPPTCCMRCTGACGKLPPWSLSFFSFPLSVEKKQSEQEYEITARRLRGYVAHSLAWFMSAEGESSDFIKHINTVHLNNACS